MLLFVASISFGCLFLKPMQDRIAALQRDAKSLRLEARTGMPKEKGVNPVEQLAQFYRFFPSQEAATDVMAAMYTAAAEQKLNLDQAEYRLVHDRDGKLSRYEVTLLVKGGYVQVRKFVARAMGAVPTMSLDGITFSRQKSDDAAVDVQLRFTLYLGAE